MNSESNSQIIGSRIHDLLGNLVAEVVRPTLQLRLPNLQVGDCHVDLIGQQLEVWATVWNVGSARSASCDVIAIVSLSASGPTPTLAARCPALPLGTAYRLQIGTIPNVTAQSQLVTATIIVDPPSAVRPGGEVWESNEADNICYESVLLVPLPEGHRENGGHLPEEPTKPTEPDPPDPPILKR